MGRWNDRRGTNGDDSLVGSNYSEYLIGRGGDDTIRGNGGHDRIFGGDGNDVLDGGTGNDRLFGGEGNDSIDGGEGCDVVVAGNGNDTVNAGDHSDWISAGNGYDLVDAGSGNDVVYGGSGFDTINAGEGNDRVYGGSGNDSIDGGAGNDVIFGGSGNDTIDAGSGNDWVSGGSGNDSIDGGSGNDRVYGGNGNDTIDGGSGNDRLYAGRGDDQVQGGDGDDLISGYKGDDALTGGAGNDTIYGGKGNDAIRGDGDGFDGLSGPDTLTQQANGTYDISGLDAVEFTVDFLGGSAGFKNSFGYYLADASGDPINGQIIFENVKRSDADAGDDVRTISLDGADIAGASSLGFFLIPDGDRRNWRLDDGDDVTFSQQSDGDWQAISGGRILNSAFGRDGIFFSNAALNKDGMDHEVDNGLPGNSAWEDLLGGGDNDFNDATFQINVFDGPQLAFNDAIDAGKGDDTVNGDLGDDTIDGGKGDDLLQGGSGNDIVDGGKGDDELVYAVGDNAGNQDAYDGGKGTDTLTLELTNNQANALADEIQDFQDFIAANGNPNKQNGPTFNFDAIGLSARNFEALNLTILNTNPDAVDDNVSTDEDTPLLINVLGNDVDIDGDTLTITEVTQPANGLVEIVGNQVLFTPDENFNGDVSFTYTIFDGVDGFDTATVNITVNPVNDAPVAVDDSATVTEDIAASIDVLGNDSDIDGDDLTVTSATALNGSVVIETDGTLTYTSDPNYHGADTITYTISDGNGGTATAEVAVTVLNDNIDSLFTEGNDTVDFNNVTPFDYDDGNTQNALGGDDLVILPSNQAEADEAGFDTGAAFDAGSGNDTVIGGDLNDTIQGGAGDDSLSGSAGDDDLDGGDGDDVYSFVQGDGDDTVSDSGGTDRLQIDLGDANGVARIDSGRVFYSDDNSVGLNVINHGGSGEVEQIAIQGGDGNDTIFRGGGPATDFDISANLGGGNDNVDLDDNNGTANISLGDGDDIASTGSGDDTLDGGTGNDSLSAGSGDDVVDGGSGDDTFIGGAGNDSIDGGTGTDQVAFSGSSDEYNVTFNPDGSVTVVDTVAGRDGTDNLANIENAVFNDGTFFVDGTNNGPDANDDTATTDEDVAVNIDVLGNDTDFDGDSLTVTSASAANGNVTIEDDGTLTYLGNQDFNGTDTITYQISDGNGGTDTATVTVTVNAVDDVLFTNGDDVVDINNVVPGNYSDDGNITNALDGDDNVILAANATEAAEAGFTVGDTFFGGNGNDTVTGGGLDDAVDGGNGDDSLSGNAGDDTLVGGAGDDTLDGGAGIDTADYSAAAGPVEVNLQNGVASDDGDGGADTLSNIENVIGSDNNDEIFGDTGDNVLDGGAGNDVLAGDAGVDTIVGGEGDDQAFGGADNDFIDGGAGNDSLFGDVGDDTLNGGAGDDSLDGGSGNDVYNINPGQGDDTIAGSAGSDTLNIDLGDNGSTIDVNIDGLDLNAPGQGSSSIEIENGTSVEVANVIGGDGGDTINGFAAANPFFVDFDGGAGNDEIFLVTGGDGADLDLGDGNDIGNTFAQDATIFGGQGNDILIAADGDIALFGGEGDDDLDISVPTGTGVADGGAGDDSIIASNGDFDITGGTGNDTITLSNAGGTIDGGDDNDSITGLVTNATVTGGLGDDTINVNGANALVQGGDGNDALDVALSGSTVQGGAGNDTIVSDSSSFTQIEGNDGDDLITGTADNSTVQGGAGDDTISVSGIDNQIEGGTGNDSITGGASDDLIDGGADNDTLSGGGGNDTILGGAGNDVANGGAGFDNINGGDGDDALDGGDGDDTLAGGAGDDTLLGGEGDDTVLGGIGNDSVEGDNGSDDIELGDGDDFGDGGAGQDFLFGGNGNDTLIGGEGDDILDGGADDDVVDGGSGNDTITAGAGNDIVDGGDGNDDIDLGTGDDVADGGAGDDNIDGGDGNDAINGGDGNDTLNGGAGDDTLLGGAGDDEFVGGAGDDSINGGDGNDNATFSGSVDDFDVTFNPDGTVTITDNAGGQGTDVLEDVETVTFDDGTFFIDGTNNAPQAFDDTATTDEDVAVNIDVAANDEDFDGDALGAVSASALNGSVVVETDGTITYTGNQDFNGTDTITYTVSDGNGGTDTATVDVTVNAVNDAPVIDDVASDLTGDMTVGFTRSDSLDANALFALFNDPSRTATVIDEGGLDVLHISTGGVTRVPFIEIPVISAGEIGADTRVTVLLDGEIQRTSGDQDMLFGVADSDQHMSLFTTDGTIGGLFSDSILGNGSLGVAFPENAPFNDRTELGFGSSVEDFSVRLDLQGDADQITLVEGDGATLNLSGDPGLFLNNDDALSVVVAGDQTHESYEFVSLAYSFEVDGLIDSGSIVFNDVDAADVHSASVTNVAVSGDSNGIANATFAGFMTLGAVTSAAGAVAGNVDWSFEADDTLFTYLGAGESIDIAYTIEVDDNAGGTDSETVTVTVNGRNEAPVATDDVATTDEDVAVNIDVLSNDSDGDKNDVLTVSSASAANGQVTIEADGSLTYLGNQDFNGTDTITYTVDDGNGGTDTAEVTVTVNAVNDIASIAGDVAGDVVEDGVLTASGQLTVSDVDAGEAEAQPQAGTAGTFGTFSVDANGDWDYTLNNNDPAVQALGCDETVTDSFTVMSADGTASETVVITVTGTNDLPVVSGAVDGGTTNEDAALQTLDLLANATDVDGDDLATSNVSVASSNAARAVAFTVDDATGQLSVDPAQFNDLAVGESETLTVSYDVIEEDRVVDDALGSRSVPNNGGYYVFDLDSGSLSFEFNVPVPGNAFPGPANVPTNGVVFGMNPNNSNFGVFVSTFEDGVETQRPGSEQSIAEYAGSFTVGATSVSYQDATNGADLTWSGTMDDGCGPSNVSITLNNLVFTDAFPGNLGVGSVDASAVPQGVPATATLMIEGRNDAPDAANDTATTDEDVAVNIDVLGNDSDVDGDALTVDSASATNGQVTIEGDGSLTYLGNQDFNGTDTITYQISDGNGGTDTATVDVTVNAINDAPELTLPSGMALRFDGNVANHVQVAHDAGLSATSWTVEAWVTTSDADGQFNRVVTKPVGGGQTYSLVVRNGEAHIRFDDPGLGQQFVQAGFVADGQPHHIAGVFDDAGNTLSLYVDGALAGSIPTSGTPRQGTEELNIGRFNDGFSQGFVGDISEVRVWSTARTATQIADNFDEHLNGTNEPDLQFYTTFDRDFSNPGQIADLSGNGFDGTVFGSLTSVPGTTPVDQTIRTDEGTEVRVLGGAVADIDAAEGGNQVQVVVTANNGTIDVSSGTGATIVDDQTTSVTITGTQAQVSASLANMTYTPDAGFVGDDTITFTADDLGNTGSGGALTDVQTLTVQVFQSQVAPVAQDDTATTDEDVAVNIDVLANDSDANGDALTVTNATAANGQVTIEGDGSLTYLGNQDFNGTDTITYTVSDGNGGTAEATVDVTVNPINDAPAAANDTATVLEDNSVLIDVLGNDIDVDGDALTVSAVGTASNGTVAIEANQVRYTPDANFFGSDSFTYTVIDGNGGTDTASVNVTIDSDGIDFIFTSGDDTVDLNAINLADFEGASQVQDALAGNDDVILPDNVTEAAQVGFDLNATFFAGAGNDLVTASNVANIIDGGSGDDTINAGRGADTLEGGSGTDLLVINFANDSSAVIANRTGDDISQVTSFEQDGQGTIEISGFERASLVGGNGLDQLIGGALSDTLIGNAGADLIIGGGSADSLDGGLSTDTIFGSALDTIDGGAQDDLLHIDLSAQTQNINFVSGGVTLNDGTTIANIEQLNTSFGSGNDQIILADFDLLDDNISLGAGDDTVNAGRGTDSLDGGDGTDLLIINFLNDSSAVTATRTGDDITQVTAFSQDGEGDINIANFERVSLTGANGTDVLIGGALSDTLIGNAGSDTIFGSALDSIDGGISNDILHIDLSAQTQNIVFENNGLSLVDGTSVASIEQLNASFGSGNDSINMGNFELDDVLLLGAGNDTVDGGRGADTLDGGAGTDLLIIDFLNDSSNVIANRTGDDITQVTSFQQQGEGTINITGFEHVSLTGSNSFDELVGGALSDTLIGNAGNDTIFGSALDSIDGGLQNDLLHIDLSAQTQDIVFANEGTNLLDGTTIADIERLNASFGSGNDSVDLDSGLELSDTLSLGAGNDTVNAGRGADTLDGGDGTDLLIIDFTNDSSSVVANRTGDDISLVTSFQQQGEGDITITGFERVSLTGGNSFDELIGGALSDTLIGNAGNDLLIGGASADSQSGGLGNDTIIGSALDTIDGGGQNDLLHIDLSAQTEDIDFLSGGMVLSDGTTVSGIEHLNASFGSGNDQVILVSNAELDDTISLGAGDDTLNAGRGTNILDGGDGTDLLIIDFTNDASPVLATRTGDDISLVTAFTQLGEGDITITGFERVSLIGGNSFDELVGGALSDTLIGNAGVDTIFGSALDSIDGGLQNDILHIDLSAQTEDIDFLGGGMNLTDGTTVASIEQLNATFGSGNDSIDMGNQFLDDTIALGAGDDTVDAGRGADSLDGGTGTDLLIIDFSNDSSPVIANRTGDDISLVTSFTQLGEGDITIAGFERASLTGSNSFDELVGGSLSDTLIGNAGNDTIFGTALDSIDGGLQNDLLHIDLSAQTEDIDFIGGGMNLTDGTSVASIEQLNATFGSGNDSIDMGNALLDDIISGGAGNDTIAAGRGTDILDGGDGTDLLVINFANDSSPVTFDGASAHIADITRFQQSGQGDINITGFERASLTGGAAADHLVGGDLSDTLSGGTGNDTLIGNGGDDVIFTGAGTNVVDAGGGDDLVVVGTAAQSSTLEGGSGTDTADFSNVGAVQSNDGGQTVTIGSRIFTLQSFENVVGVNFTPVAADDSATTDEDVGVNINVLANDSDANADSLTVTSASALNGTVVIEANGTLTYTGNANFNGTDTISYTIDDGNGGTDTAEVAVTVNPVLDALFTANADSVDMNAATAADVEDGNVTNALAGDDVVTLPGSAADAADVGFTVGATFFAGDGNDTITGGALDDVIDGGAGIDGLFGGDGNDTLLGGDQSDTLDGGAGVDTADFSTSTFAISADVAGAGPGFGFAFPATVAGPTDFLLNIENLVGSGLADSLTGDSGDNVLDGGDGADTLTGGDGDDTLTGGDGDDILIGGNGNDSLVGGAGNDTLLGGDQPDRIDGGAGVDTVDFSTSTFGINADIDGTGLGAGFAVPQAVSGPIDFLFNIENIVGSGFADSLSGDDNANEIHGGLGDDSLVGDGGADTLEGGAGDDHFIFNAGDGADQIGDFIAGAGTDDLLDFSNVGSVTGLGDLTIVDDINGDAVVTYGTGDQITLIGVSSASLDTDDFSF